MKSLVAALQFLTVCPFVSRIACSEREIGRSAPWFPLVGLLIGAAVALLDCGLGIFFPKIISSVVSVIALIAVSGGLHADGLADTADGFFSSRPRERMLEIMRDSRIGAMGVLGLMGAFALKVAALASVPNALRWQALLLMPFAGRCSMVLQLSLLNYARTGGLCSAFVQNRKRLDVLLTLIVMGAAGWLIGSEYGVCAVCISIICTVIFSFWCRGKIGGFTGDTLGAGCELIELIPALVAVAWMVK